MMKRFIDFSPNRPPALPSDFAGVWGAFLMEGLMVSTSDTSRSARILDTWHSGCIELVREACDALDFAWQQLQPYLLTEEPFPGVFEYEVVSELGRFIGNYLLERGNLPSPGQVESMTTELIAQFFEPSSAHAT